MANISVTWTNGRKTLQVQGRESRMQRKFNGYKADHQCKRVCVLNEDEAERLEHGGENFPCHSARGRQHTHYSRAQAEVLVDKGEARWVGNGQNVLTFVTAKTWQPMMSGGMNVMQMVPGGACF